MKRNPVMIISLLVVTILLVLSYYWYFVRDDSLIKHQKGGVIRIGYAVEAPFAFIKSGGEVTGESPEIAKRMVAELGIQTIEWRLMEFGSLISELESGRIDVIAAGMFITPERALRVNFSEPTFHVQQGLLVTEGNPSGIHSYQQLANHNDQKIAVLSGSIEHDLLKRMGFPDAQLIIVPDALTGRVAVESGYGIGLALSSPAIYWMAIQGQLDGVENAQPFDQPNLPSQEMLGYGAFAFRKSDVQLLNAWNSALKDYIGSPEHIYLMNEFGLSESELPGSISTKEIISGE